MNFIQGKGLAKSKSHARLEFAIVITRESIDHYWVPIG